MDNDNLLASLSFAVSMFISKSSGGERKPRESAHLIHKQLHTPLHPVSVKLASEAGIQTNGKTLRRGARLECQQVFPIRYTLRCSILKMPRPKRQRGNGAGARKRATGATEESMADSAARGKCRPSTDGRYREVLRRAIWVVQLPVP